MKKSFRLFSFVRHYPLSCLFVAAIWVACFMDVPETPLDNVAFMDKWTHLAMYGSTCAIIYVEHMRHTGRSQGFALRMLWCWLLPVLMSGLIEILQATCTGGRRSGDWLDFAANSVGATLGAAIGILLARCLATGRRG